METQFEPPPPLCLESVGLAGLRESVCQLPLSNLFLPNPTSDACEVCDVSADSSRL